MAFWQGLPRATFLSWQNTAFTDQNSLAQDPRFVDPAGTDGVLGYAGPAADGRDDDFHLQSVAGSYRGGSLAPVLDPITGLPVELAGTWTADAVSSPAIERGDGADSFANEPAPNGNYVNLGACGNTAQASRSLPEYVLVMQPDGGEYRLAEQTFAIRWRSQDFTGTVDIELMADGQADPVAGIAAGTDNDGEFVWTVPESVPPGDNYRIRITRGDGVRPADSSNAPFHITGPIHTYYVNDGTVEDGDWTVNPGDDGNNGFLPFSPKASVSAVLNAYNLGPGDVIKVDAGNYELNVNLKITDEDSGVRIEGYHEAAYPTRAAVLNRGNTHGGSYVVELAGADDVRLEHLSLTGGHVGVYVADGSQSDRLVVSQCVVFGNTGDGLYVGAGNADVQLTGNRVYNNGGWGIDVGNNWSTSWSDRVVVSGNRVHDNAAGGIAASYRAEVSENTVYRHAERNGISVEWGAAAAGNVVFDNGNGIWTCHNGPVQGNRAYHNAQAGIVLTDGSPLVSGNVVYGNPVGIGARSWHFGGTPANNLAYGNTEVGLRIAGAGVNGLNRELVNNTVYQPVGDAVRVEGGSRNVQLRNNILWIWAGWSRPLFGVRPCDRWRN